MLTALLRCRARGFVLLAGLAGCIEGDDPDQYSKITPRPCEAAIAPDQEIVLDGSFDAQDARYTLDGCPLLE